MRSLKLNISPPIATVMKQLNLLLRIIYETP